MLSLFPQLFFLAPLGYTLLRATLAILFFMGLQKQWRIPSLPLRILLGVESLVALALVFGYLAQLAALIAIAIFIIWTLRPQLSPYSRSTALLGVVIAIVVLIGGAGPFALDLPL